MTYQRTGHTERRSSFGALAASVLERVGFWGSVILPAMYLPVLYSLAHGGRVEYVAGLLVLHALCLVIGHDYHR